MRVGGVLLSPPERRWECPNCDRRETTRGGLPYAPMHNCPGLRGLSAPMVAAGTAAKVEAVERGDYVGTDLVQVDDAGRPVMAIVTTRDEGTDMTVLAPTATAATD